MEALCSLVEDKDLVQEQGTVKWVAGHLERMALVGCVVGYLERAG